MQPALSQVCSLDAPFEQDIVDYAAGACRAIELWLGKLETYLQSHTVDDVKRLCAENEVITPVASFQGGLLTSQGEFRREHWETFTRRLALCKQLDVQTLVVAADIYGQLTQQDFERTQLSLKQAAEQAIDHGVR